MDRPSATTTITNPWTLHGFKVYPFGIFCGTRLIDGPACLMSAELNRPTIELQLSGDPSYDYLKRNLLQSRGESPSSSMLRSLVSRWVPGLGYPATREATDVLREDIRFFESLHLAASRPDEQRIVNDIKKQAVRIFDRRAKRTINGFISALNLKLTMRTNAELDHTLAQNVELKTHDAWNTLRGVLVDELSKSNSSPGIS